MKAYMGLDIGNATIKAALFKPSESGAKTLASETAQETSSAVGFLPQRSGGVLSSTPIFPVDDSFEAAHPDGLLIPALKRTLLPLTDRSEIESLMTPVFHHFRRQFEASEMALTLVVPAEYPVTLCVALTHIAVQSGFSSCSYVNELTAAVLSCLSRWRLDARRWAALASGQHIWILDSGAFDLNIALVKAERNEDAISIYHLSGDCLRNFGSCNEDLLDEEAFQARFRNSLSSMLSLPDEEIVPQNAWAICSGRGKMADKALAILREKYESVDQVSEQLIPTHVLVSGAAMHAAMLSGAAGLRFGVIEARRRLGMRVELEDGTNFLPFIHAGHRPPYEFEGVYRFETDSRPLEITLAAALPGGERSASILTFILNKQDLSTLPPVGIIVRGSLDTWVSGRVNVHDLHNGARLKESIFRLP